MYWNGTLCCLATTTYMYCPLMQEYGWFYSSPALALCADLSHPGVGGALVWAQARVRGYSPILATQMLLCLFRMRWHVFVCLAESIFISLFFHCSYNVGSVIVYLAGQCRNRILFCHVLCHDVQSAVSTELSLTLLPAETCFYKAHNNRFYIRH